MRSYTGSTVGIDFTSHTIPTGATDRGQTIGLYKHNCVLFVCNDDIVGSVNKPYRGFIAKTWTASNGDYRFRFTKVQDYVTVWSDDVHMFSN